MLLLGERTVSIWPLSADDYKAKVSFLGRASSKGTINRMGRMFHDETLVVDISGVAADRADLRSSANGSTDWRIRRRKPGSGRR